MTTRAVYLYSDERRDFYLDADSMEFCPRHVAEGADVEQPTPVTHRLVFMDPEALPGLVIE